MKKVLGGLSQLINSDCEGTVTCRNGSVLSGIFDCNDMSTGEDGDTCAITLATGIKTNSH